MLGSGVGGSSALYGMVLERFFPDDFTPRANFADVAGSTVPEAWPVSYEDMVPWYERAEALYRVRGSADPLRVDGGGTALLPPGPMTAANSQLAEFLAGRGMHPYGLHVACEYRKDCRSCQSFLCPANCKNHAGNICVEPALRDHRAVLLDDTTVVRLEASRTAVTEVVARRHGGTLVFRGKTVVLAGGAFMTPTLLLRSASRVWPYGLANDHDIVGRNLMRHIIDVYLFRAPVDEPVTGQVKQIGVNDFYRMDGQRYGTLQSLGAMPPFAFLMNVGRAERRVLGPFRSLGRRWTAFGREQLIPLATIVEDLPHAENRVLPGSGDTAGGKVVKVRVNHIVSAADRKRNRELAVRLKRSFAGYRRSRLFPIHLSMADSNNGVGHHCGTCRFGDDPRTSALDPTCRAWGLDNLYVVDASVLPSSAGINPSLTIAANAL
ncbi:GMC oxidoreductase, partial [Kibdelosporangium lantanae]